jgi:hypothetical protein
LPDLGVCGSSLKPLSDEVVAGGRTKGTLLLDAGVFF